MYHYKECGLKNVWLVNGFEIKKTPYGKRVSITNLPGLHKLIDQLVARDKDRHKQKKAQLKFQKGGGWQLRRA